MSPISLSGTDVHARTGFGLHARNPLGSTIAFTPSVYWNEALAT